MKEKKELFKLQNGNYGQTENSTFYTSASPKKKEPKNIQLRKQENFNTITKSNSFSTNSFKNSKHITQKLYDIELKMKAYLKESHRFFKTKSIDQFLEGSSNFKKQTKLGSIADFDKFANLSLNSNKRFKAEIHFQVQNDNINAINNNDYMKDLNDLNTVSYQIQDNNFLDSNRSMLSNKDKNLNIETTLNIKNKIETEKSNISSINYSTNYHKNTTAFNCSNGTIPSIFKNFFEEKETKDLNKKRHSMALGDLLYKKQLKNINLSECDIKQNYKSNNAMNSNNIAKSNFFLDNSESSSDNSHQLQSRISDFSLDINLNIVNSRFLKDLDCEISNCNKSRNSLKILKRNSILKERKSSRANIYLSNIDIVEEEKLAIVTNSYEENSDE